MGGKEWKKDGEVGVGRAREGKNERDGKHETYLLST